MRWKGVHDTAEAARKLGPKLRTIREAKGMTLRQLADRIGASKNTILRIEQGLPISETILLAICQELETSLSGLIDSETPVREAVRVVRAGESKRLPFARGRVGVLSLELDEPRGFAERLRGVECMIACLSGALVLEFEGKRHDLAAGDCAVFNSANMFAMRPVEGRARALLFYEDVSSPRGQLHLADSGRPRTATGSLRSRV